MMNLRKLVRSSAAVAGAYLGLCALAASSDGQTKPNSVGFALYFESEVHDASECAMSTQGGAILVDPRVGNPAMSCPDMFSWKLFVDVVGERWWSNWASDTQTWPEKPFELCESAKSGPDCCVPGVLTNPGYLEADNPAIHCPYFPGDSAQMDALRNLPRMLREPIGAHAIFLGRDGLGTGLAASREKKSKAGEPEPGRAIRQEVGEITVRNKDMFDYIFKNDLYNAEGVAGVFDRNKSNLANNAPYQAATGPAPLSKIDLPLAAIMIKSNWLFHQFAKDMGLIENSAAPYIKKNMTTILNEGTPNETKYSGEHWLMSFHISTKDIPQWVWATFEHVSNPGRCDFTGCNDSYGYASADVHPKGTSGNFTAPFVRNDGLQQSSTIFDLGKTYPTETISTSLSTIFAAMKMGTTIQVGLDDPKPTDKGWLSYRLKGSQVNFTNTMGRATRLGNSITEGGFMATSSCVTCHARASIAATGVKGSPIVPPLGVFLFDELSEVGYRQSSLGVPNKDWFHGSGGTPALEALQTDFLWGMPFFAQPLAP